jgi:hypothetical protein
MFTVTPFFECLKVELLFICEYIDNPIEVEFKFNLQLWEFMPVLTSPLALSPLLKIPNFSFLILLNLSLDHRVIVLGYIDEAMLLSCLVDMLVY